MVDIVAQGLGAIAQTAANTAARKDRIRALIASARRSFQANPRVNGIMASNPTFTWSTSAPAETNFSPPSVSTIASFTPYWRLYGGGAMVFGGGMYPVPVINDPTTWTAGNRTGLTNNMSRFGFRSTGTLFTFRIAANSMSTGTQLRLIVDDKYAGPLVNGAPPAVTLPSDLTVIQYLTIDLGGSRVPEGRDIQLEVGGTAGLTRIYAAQTETFVPMLPKLQLLVGGDSWTEGPTSSMYTTPTALKGDGMTYVMADYMGMEGIQCGLGGTGWAQPSGNRPALPGHLYDFRGQYPDGSNKAVYPYNPDLIFLSTLQNDTTNGQTQAATVAGALATVSGLRASYPTTPIVVTGGFTPRNIVITAGALATMQTYETAIQAALAGLNDPWLRFIPTATSTPRWMTGTGNALNPTTDGNSTWAGGIDSNHLSYAGNASFGKRLAQEAIACLEDMALS